MLRVQFALVSLLILFLLLAGIRTAWGSRFWRDIPKSYAVGLTCCFLIALIARMSARPFPAAHSLASSQGSAILLGEKWSAGFGAILHFFYIFFPSNVATVAGMNALVGASTVLVVFAFVDVYFKDRFAAFSAAAVLACQPISARYAASDSPHVLLAFCLLAACLFLARWRGGGSLLPLQGAGWLALAANIRHEGAVYVLVGALILAGGTARMTRKGLARLRVPGLLCMIFLCYPAMRLLRALASGSGDTISVFGFLEAFFLSEHSPPSIAALAVLGVLWAMIARFRQATSFLLALVVISLPTYFTAHSDMANRHSLPHLAAWSVFAGCGFSAAMRAFSRFLAAGGRADAAAQAAATSRLPPLGAAAVLAVVLWAAAPHRGFLAKMWTHALEYDFIVAHLGAIPDRCIMIWPGPIGEWQSRGLRISEALSWEVGKRHRWLSASDAEITEGDVASCAVFYRATSCFSYEPSNSPGRKKDWTGAERPVCRQMRERFHLEPIATTTIPAIPYMSEAYSVNPLPAGFYQVRAASPRQPRSRFNSKKGPTANASRPVP